MCSFHQSDGAAHQTTHWKRENSLTWQSLLAQSLSLCDKKNNNADSLQRNMMEMGFRWGIEQKSFPFLFQASSDQYVTHKKCEGKKKKLFASRTREQWLWSASFQFFFSSSEKENVSAFAFVRLDVIWNVFVHRFHGSDFVFRFLYICLIIQMAKRSPWNKNNNFGVGSPTKFSAFEATNRQRV